MEKMTNPLYCKKIVVIGDSMVQGNLIAETETWLHKLSEKNNMVYVNYGVDGCYLSGNNRTRIRDGVVTVGVTSRYTEMDNDADYVIVFGGTNDANNLITMGEESSEDTTTFNGSLNVLIQGLLTKYPNGKIAFITPYNQNASCETYANAIIDACKRNGGIPVFSNLINGGICWSNQAQRTALTQGDNTHLNENGHTWVVSKYEAFIKAL